MSDLRNTQSPIQSAARTALNSLQKLRSQALNDSELQANAIVFAPHPDDETLGCGGTILKKLAAGAGIHVVFMTDGAGSHAGRIEKSRLVAMRKEEALAATLSLGIHPSNVHFLMASDGNLTDADPGVIARIRALISELRPAQLFAPYSADRVPDHVATNRLVIAAAQNVSSPLTILEFPVWFWNFWPFMRQEPVGITGHVKAVQNSLYSTARSLLHFNRHNRIDTVLAQKLLALECHKSQMMRQDHQPDWGTLADVAQGDFLQTLASDIELFRSRSINN